VLFVLFYALLFLKQSMHFKLLVSRGVKGSDEILPPQPAHCQLPEIFGLSPVDGAAAGPKPSSSAGPLDSPASKGPWLELRRSHLFVCRNKSGKLGRPHCAAQTAVQLSPRHSHYISNFLDAY
jgi:hypothetical protein